MTWAGSMRRCASRVAMRRISCVDQPMRAGSASVSLAAGFLGWLAVRMMADRCQHGEGQHHQRDMTMPTVPGAGFIVVEAKLVLAGLETVLDAPTLPFHRHQRLDAGASRAPGGEVGALAIADSAPDQQAAGPQSALPAVVFAGIEIGQFQIRPVIQPRPFRSFSGGETLPGRGIE